MLTIAVPIIMIPLGLDFALAVAGAITFGIAILDPRPVGRAARAAAEARDRKPTDEKQAAEPARS